MILLAACKVLALAPLKSSSPVAEWPLEFVHGQVVVRVKLSDGRAIKLLVDTGSRLSCVSRRVARSQNVGSGEQQWTEAVTVGGYTLALSLRVKSEDDDRMFFSRVAAGTDGVLGMDAFVGQRVGFDLGRKRLIFYRYSDFIKAVCDDYFEKEPPLSFPSANSIYPTLPVEIGGTREAFVVDTGAYRSAVDTEFAKDLALGPKPKPVGVKMPDGEVIGGLYPPVPMRIGAEELIKTDTVAVPLPGGIRGLVGLLELRKMRLLWDPQARCLYTGSKSPRSAALPVRKTERTDETGACLLASRGRVPLSGTSKALIGPGVPFAVPTDWTVRDLGNGYKELLAPHHQKSKPSSYRPGFRVWLDRWIDAPGGMKVFVPRECPSHISAGKYESVSCSDGYILVPLSS